MISAEKRERLQQNWQQVVDEVHAAAIASGRSPDAVRIVGIAKYVDAETTAALCQAGCRHLGESRPQVLWQKAESGAIPADVHWHLVGHLQRNKIRRTLRFRPVIHSVDSGRLLQAVAEEAQRQQVEIETLLEVNISGEEAKTGMAADDLPLILQRLPAAGVRVVGLMAMAGWNLPAEEAREQFAAVRRLRDQLTQQIGCYLPELSMGMSGDFAEAIAEGATIVRIGSRLFEGVRDE